MPRRLDLEDAEALLAEAAGLRAYAVRLVGEYHADDKLQDAIVATLRRAPIQHPVAGSPLRQALLAVAMPRLITRFPAPLRPGRIVEPTTCSTGEIVQRTEVWENIADEVERLDEPYRSSLLAVYFELQPMQAYARTVGVSSATMRWRLKRGLDLLRARLVTRFDGDLGVRDVISL